MTTKSRSIIYILLVVIYMVMGLLITNHATNIMTDREYTLIATKSRDLAVLAAKSYRITDSEVEELKSLKFGDLRWHPANTRLENMFGEDFNNDEIRFAYIMVRLDEAQVKYTVTDEYADFYDAQVGVPLDLMWLVDVVVGSTYEETLAEDEAYYDDIKRYSYLQAEDEPAYESRTPAYSLTDDEYGRVISGLAPVYTDEGNFVGMLGVDIYIEHYEKEINQIRMILLYVFIAPTAILTAAFIFLNVKNTRRAYSTAYTDSLTSINNRRFIDKVFPTIVKEHHKKRQPLSVIMIDVDYFKLYNDNYGHQKGDEVLVKISATIKSALREKTDFVCRYGGEEVFVILTNTDKAVAERVAGRIKSSIGAASIKHEYSGVSDVVTVSQGVYTAVPNSVDSDKEYIMHADKGLYDAKHNGRNQYSVVDIPPP